MAHSLIKQCKKIPTCTGATKFFYYICFLLLVLFCKSVSFVFFFLLRKKAQKGNRPQWSSTLLCQTFCCSACEWLTFRQWWSFWFTRTKNNNNKWRRGCRRKCGVLYYYNYRGKLTQLKRRTFLPTSLDGFTTKNYYTPPTGCVVHPPLLSLLSARSVYSQYCFSCSLISQLKERL